jgi:hypothetical protein
MSIQLPLNWVQEWLNQKGRVFTLYRCTFNDNEAWEKCQNILQKAVAKNLDLTGCTINVTLIMLKYSRNVKAWRKKRNNMYLR